MNFLTLETVSSNSLQTFIDGNHESGKNIQKYCVENEKTYFLLLTLSLAEDAAMKNKPT